MTDGILTSFDIKRIGIAVMLVSLLSACVGAGSNSSIEPLAPDRFPKVTGISLLGDDVALPDGFEGEANLVSMGFVHRHQDDINTWIEALPAIQRDVSALKFYEVPVIYEAGPLFRWWLNNGMRIGVVEEEARRRTITVYTDRDRFMEAIDLPDLDDIHTLLVDRDGRIVWRTRGPMKIDDKDRVVRFSKALLAAANDDPS